MKKIIIPVLFFACFQLMNAQTVFEDYIDNYIYLKTNRNCGDFLRSTGEISSRASSAPSGEEVLQLQQILEKYAFKAADNYFAKLDHPVFANVFQLEFDKKDQVESFIADLEKCACVDYAEKRPLYKTTYRPNDPRLGSQWTMNAVDAQAAWDIHRGAKREVVIAIVDDAVRITHEDLWPNRWINKGEIPGNGIDDDGNGYIDDVYGYDVSNDRPDPNPPSRATNFEFSHGTHCAGIAGAATDNGIGVASLGYDSKIMSVKAKNDNNFGSGIDATDRGIVYATVNKADVISMSFGGGGNSNTIQNVFNFGKRQGTINIAAAGNDNSDIPHYPAAAANVLAVASTSSGDSKSGFSNFGDWVDIAAPGSNILSTVAGSNSSYTNYSGTSMACPNVAGLAGYLFSYHPNVLADDVMDCLLSSADNIDDVNPGFENLLGVGRINARKAIECLAGKPAEARAGYPRVHFQNTPTIFTDRSLNGKYTRWNIDQQQIETENDVIIAFGGIGSFEVALEVDENARFDGNIHILPTLNVPYNKNTPGYQGDFEGNLTHFAVDQKQGSPWVQGNSSVSGKNGTNSGNNAFVLAPDNDFFEPNTFADLYTPMFDFTQQRIYEISFFAKFDLGSGLDGFHVEYTIDEGKTWKKLGDRADSWYNLTNTSLGISAYLLGDSYFSGRQINFKQFRYNVTQEVIGQKAAFRFVFISQERGFYTGMVIDDFEVNTYEGELKTNVVHFEGDFNKDRRVQLFWTTRPEFHCKSFRIEMSPNGKTYQTEGTVQAGNFSAVNKNYSFLTPNVRNRDLYFYRLYVINEDEDGNYSEHFYSEIIPIRRNIKGVELYEYSPNPFGQVAGFTFTEPLKTDFVCRVYDISGKQVLENRQGPGQVYYQVPCQQIPPGTYVFYMEYGPESTQNTSVKLQKF